MDGSAAKCSRAETARVKHSGSFDRAIDIDPHSDQRDGRLKADLLLKIRSTAEALRTVRNRGRRRHQRRAHVWTNRARALRTAGRASDAVASMNRAIELSDAPAIWVLRGEVQMRADQLGDARTSFGEGGQIKPSAIDAWYHLGLVCAKAKDVEAAKNACHKFLEASKEGDARNAAMRSLLFALDGAGDPQVSGIQQRRPAKRISSSRMRRVSRGLKAVNVPPPPSSEVEPAPESNRQVAEVTDYEDGLAVSGS